MLRRETLALLLILIAWAPAPSPVAAYDDAPLCVFRDDDWLSDSLDPELQCEPQRGALRLPDPQWTAPISAAEARSALAHAEELIRDEKLGDALLELRLVEQAMPRIRDRIALRRAGLLMHLGRPADACEAYAIAEQSLDRNVAAEARIAMVRCMLEAGERGGEVELEQIMRRYPHMGGRAELRLELARARQGWGNTAGAVAIYRSIDLDEPESEVASDARAAMAAIAASGFAVRPYSAAEQVDRAERLVLHGSVEGGRAAVTELLANASLPAAQSGRAHVLAARIARIEGRWDDARDEVALAIKLGVPAPEAQRFLPRGALPAQDADPSTLKADGELAMKRMLGGRTMQKLQTPQLRAALELAVRYELHEPATAALEALRERKSVQPALRFEAAMLAFGLASDESVAGVLETVMDTRAYALSARYHHARALERLGRYQDAEADFRRVLEQDKVEPRYYAMWADLRLWAMRSEQAQTCVPEGSQLSGNAVTTLARRQADAKADAKRIARDLPSDAALVSGGDTLRHADADAATANEARRGVSVARARG